MDIWFKWDVPEADEWIVDFIIEVTLNKTIRKVEEL